MAYSLEISAILTTFYQRETNKHIAELDALRSSNRALSAQVFVYYVFCNECSNVLIGRRWKTALPN